MAGPWLGHTLGHTLGQVELSRPQNAGPNLWLTYLTEHSGMHPASQMLMFGTARYWSSSFVFCGILVRGSDVIWPFRIFDYMCGLPPQPPRTRHLAHDLGRASITAHPPNPLLPPSRLLPHTLRLTPCSSLLCVAQLAAPLALERSWL